MDTTILCKTKIKDSLSEEGVRWYKEYGVFANLTNDEIDRYSNSPFGMRELYKWSYPCITVSRKVTVSDEGQSFGKWVLYDGFENIQSASMGFVDSDYWFNSESVDHLHAQAVERNNKVNSLRDEYHELELTIKSEFRNGNKLKDKYNDLYDAELKSKKLYSKAKKGTAPQNVIDEITNRLKAEYENELLSVELRLAEIKQEIEKEN